MATDTYKHCSGLLAEKAADRAKSTDPLFERAAQKIADLAKSGFIDLAGLSRSYADTEQAFRDNKGVMYPMGSWFCLRRREEAQLRHRAPT